MGVFGGGGRLLTHENFGGAPRAFGAAGGYREGQQLWGLVGTLRGCGAVLCCAVLCCAHVVFGWAVISMLLGKPKGKGLIKVFRNCPLLIEVFVGYRVSRGMRAAGPPI